MNNEEENYDAKNLKDLNENETKKEKIKNTKRFCKKAFLKSGKYQKDIINAVLEDDKNYTENEAKNKIEKYLKGRVI